jgi:hypothetical protein
MSAGQPAAQPAPPPASFMNDRAHELTIVSHSNLFYWWPVWAVGFLFALLSEFSGHIMAIVPDGATARKEAEVKQDAGEPKKLDIIQVDPGKDGKHGLPKDRAGNLEQPRLKVTTNKNLGVIFAIVLILVIIITNVPLRGMWSLVIILMAIMLSIIFYLADWWARIVDAFHFLDVRINMGGYLLISGCLFIAWCATFFFFDRQIYITFAPGQFKVRSEIGGGEQVYDTMGLTLERQRSDLFRHWIIGLGSGDLIVKTSGAQAHHFDLPNVLFINRKVQQIEEIIKSRKVVETR